MTLGVAQVLWDCLTGVCNIELWLMPIGQANAAGLLKHIRPITHQSRTTHQPAQAHSVPCRVPLKAPSSSS